MCIRDRPIFGSVTLFLLVIGAGNTIQSHSQTGVATSSGHLNFLLPLGLAGVAALFYFWFRDTVRESLGNRNSLQMDQSYRQGMTWFIFSEIMFFAAFFGALFYARVLSVPWLGGEGKGVMTHEVLWPQFEALWPLVRMPSGATTEAMGPWGLPFLNTVILLTSSVTLTVAHHALLVGDPVSYTHLTLPTKRIV